MSPRTLHPLFVITVGACYTVCLSKGSSARVIFGHPPLLFNFAFTNICYEYIHADAVLLLMMGFIKAFLFLLVQDETI